MLHSHKTTQYIGECMNSSFTFPQSSLLSHLPLTRSISFKSPIILSMGHPEDWKHGISEVSRINRKLMSELCPSTFVNVNAWQQNIRLSYTRHATKRMWDYVNKISDKPWDNGVRYIEFYPQEARYLENPNNLQQHFHKAQRVEIGLNKYGKVCKVSYALYLNEECPFLYTGNGNGNEHKRCLFFCVGVDGGIKTMNICPEQKQRNVYGGRIEYLTLDSLHRIIKQNPCI
jgi:hypothetical protein